MASLKCKEIFCLLYSGILFLSGVVFIGLSSYLSYKIFYHFKFIPGSTIGPFIVIFLLGIVHLFVTWLGIKGPQREHDFHIILFMVITLCLLAGECAVGIWSMILWDEVDVNSIQLMTDSFEQMIKLDLDKNDWRSLQTELKCCGLTGSKDYSVKASYPESCFNLEMTNGTFQMLYQDGCKKPLIRYAKYILIDGAIIGFLACVYQALGIFVFYTYFKSLRAERQARMARRLAAQRELAEGEQPRSASSNPPNPQENNRQSQPQPPQTPTATAPSTT